MTLDEVLQATFADSARVARDGGVLMGPATLKDGTAVSVLGVSDGTKPGVDEALRLARYVLQTLKEGSRRPLIVLIDSGSQRMSRRDELLGLSEALGHLAKCLFWAEREGAQTCSVLYGHTAAGAFIATALATRDLLATPDSHPAVMDLPSMARVTKLPLEVLQQKAQSTPVFAPGIDNLFQTGAVQAIVPAAELAARLQSLLHSDPFAHGSVDRRDRWGLERGGRPKAAEIARRVQELVLAGG